jgi:hypothetical protein
MDEGKNFMSTMIVLTAEEATAVRGPSASVEHAALMPVELEDGRYVLPVEVLDDPAHDEHHDMLVALPTADDSTLVFKTYDEPEGAPV